MTTNDPQQTRASVRAERRRSAAEKRTSRWQSLTDAIPTKLLLLVPAAVVVGIVALFGGLADAQRVYATVSAGETVDLGYVTAEVTDASVREATDLGFEPGSHLVTVAMTVTNQGEYSLRARALFGDGTSADHLDDAALGAIRFFTDHEIRLDNVAYADGTWAENLGPLLPSSLAVTFVVPPGEDPGDTIHIEFRTLQRLQGQYLLDAATAYWSAGDLVARSDVAIRQEQ